MTSHSSASVATLVLATLLVAASAAGQSLPAKQVAAPPADILSGRVVLPEPGAVGRPVSTALIDVDFDVMGVFERRLPVGSGGRLTVAALSPGASRWDVAIVRDGGAVPLNQLEVEGRATRTAGELGPLLPGVQGERWDVSGLDAGAVDVRIVTSERRPAPGVLVVSAPGPWVLASHLTSWQWTSDRPLGLRAAIERADAPGVAVVVPDLEAVLTLRAADVTLQRVLADDGRQGDGGAGDGVLGARWSALPPGTVRGRLQVRGTAPDGTPLLLTRQLAFPVVEPAARLTGDVSASIEDALRLRIALDADLFGAPRRVHVSAEVWGSGPGGEPAPATWLSTIIAPEVTAGRALLPLTLDVRWLDNASVSPPLELRAVRLQDPDTHVVLDRLPRLPFRVDALPSASGGVPGPPTPAMLMGADVLQAGGQGASLVGEAGISFALQRALLITHGYCSPGDIWPLPDFSGKRLEFFDPNANRSHDEFAQLLGSFGSQVYSHGIVGHSQGGPAALHLYTFYVSGLDTAVGGRRIQAVGAPWRGTELAGNLAVLGEIFGAGCGENTDMAPAGATLWLSTIPSWARQEVFCWTTATDGLWCNFVTSLFLSSPNDGVVEKASGELPGGNLMGHVEGWCHTTGMNDPPQYLDSTRNTEMDAEAAR